jgi:hypothetical protein
MFFTRPAASNVVLRKAQFLRRKNEVPCLFKVIRKDPGFLLMVGFILME